jgi:hypothetical protein
MARLRPIRHCLRAGARQVATGRHADAQATLEKLFAAHPQARDQAEPALLYARALSALDAPATRDAFERSLTCASDAAPRCLYADWLSRQGDAADRERAKSLYSEIVHDARHWPRRPRAQSRMAPARAGRAGPMIRA